MPWGRGRGTSHTVSVLAAGRETEVQAKGSLPPACTVMMLPLEGTVGAVMDREGFSRGAKKKVGLVWKTISWASEWMRTEQVEGVAS